MKPKIVKKLEKELEEQYGREKIKSIYTIGFLKKHPDIWKKENIAGYEKFIRDDIRWYYEDREYEKSEIDEMTLEQLENIYYSDEYKNFKVKIDKKEKEFEEIRRE